MGFDQTVFSPRISAIGDDAYNLPGSTKLDLTVDGGYPSVIKAGSSGFSVTPTLPELTASSDINQVIGMYNRRALNYNTQFGTSLVAEPYVAQDSRIRATVFTSLQTKINTLRTTEGFAAFTFTAISANTLVKGFHLAELRKSLRLSGKISFDIAGITKRGSLIRNDNPYGTLISQFFNVFPTPMNGPVVGKGNATPTTNRLRHCLSIPVPDYVDITVPLIFRCKPTFLQSGEAFLAEVFLSATNDSAYVLNVVTPAYNLNKSLGTATVVGVGTEFTISYAGAEVAARAGSYGSIIVGTDKEMSGTGVGVVNAGFYPGYTVFGQSFIELDFGA